MVSNDTWSLFHTPMYIRLYCNFSNSTGKYPGRLDLEVEELLLDRLWERTKTKNDIHWARNANVWWMDGSENHDLNSKMCNLVSSRIFMDEPDYRDRVYPDLGYGGGYHYGKAGYYGPGVEAGRHGGGRANLADGKSYTAADHYEAWLDYMKRYFAERARRGFLLERASPTYTKHSLNFIDLGYQYSGDEELKELIGDFLDLYWADFAQESISGIRGGAKTRHHKTVGGYGSGSDLLTFHLGGPSSGNVWWYWNHMNDYRLPPLVWRMALDREGMGEFVYRSRGIGEESPELPRPLGTERTLLCDTFSRFLKYTYVTPEYTLGTQMEHPDALHSHLSVAGRWHGMTIADDPACRVVPVAVTDREGGYDTELMLRTVQHESTLLVQQSRSWLARNPDWFPGVNTRLDREIGIWMGTDWDEKVERDGWIFVRKGGVYGAVRPIHWDEEAEKAKVQHGSGSQINFNASASEDTLAIRKDAYSWSADGKILLLEEKYMATIIEAGRRETHATFEHFQEDVRDNPLALYKAVVPGNYEIVYTGSSRNPREIVFNAANTSLPTVGGEYVDYSYPMTFDSPYMQSEYNSGKVVLQYDGQSKTYDFGAGEAAR